MDIVKILKDPARVAALTGGNPKATAIIVGSAEIVAQIRKHGGDIAGLITRVTDGDRSTCETGCIIVPDGARINEIRVSNRSGAENWAYTRNGPNPHDPQSPNALKFGGVLNAGSSGDWAGWEGVQVSNGARAVCGTAKNWSHDDGTHQAFRVIYDE